MVSIISFLVHLNFQIKYSYVQLRNKQILQGFEAFVLSALFFIAANYK